MRIDIYKDGSLAFSLSPGGQLALSPALQLNEGVPELVLLAFHVLGMTANPHREAVMSAVGRLTNGQFICMTREGCIGYQRSAGLGETKLWEIPL